MESLTETITEQKRSRKKNPVLAAFLLGSIAGAAAMFCAMRLRRPMTLTCSSGRLPPAGAKPLAKCFEGKRQREHEGT